MSEPPEPGPCIPCICEHNPNHHLCATSLPIDNEWFAIATALIIIIYLIKKRRDGIVNNF